MNTILLHSVYNYILVTITNISDINSYSVLVVITRLDSILQLIHSLHQ